MQPSNDEAVLLRRIAFLRNVPLFADLKEHDLEKLVDDFRLREYTKDEFIFRQGDMSCELYVIIQGKVRIFKICPAGSETSINIFSTYDVIGEFATIDEQSRSASAKAIVPTTLLQMTGNRFLAHMRAMPDLAMALARLLVCKVRWTAAYAETLAQYDTAGRLLHILLLYNEQFGQEIERGKRYELDLALNQSDLASLVSARREWINRILRDWHKRGLINYEAGKIIIMDLSRVVAERDSRIEANLGHW
jgi:CRP/FNR family cyclic AMP-dependent transcriptional regulator